MAIAEKIWAKISNIQYYIQGNAYGNNFEINSFLFYLMFYILLSNAQLY